MNLWGIIKGLLIQEENDKTKELAIEVDGSTTAEKRMTVTTAHTDDRTLNLPDATDTLVGKETSDRLKNKQLEDSSLEIIDAADATKKLIIDVGGTVGTKTTLVTQQTIDRTVNLPDADDTLVGKATTDTLTNKTIGDDLEIQGITESTDKDTGALVVQGGVGVEKNLNVGGNVLITGDLQIDGTTTRVNTTDLDVTDKNITVNKDGNDASSEGAGLTVERTGTDGSIVYEDALTAKFKVGALGSEVEIADVASAQTLTNKTIDFSTGGTNTITADSSDILYDNSTSGLTATDAQAAIDEIEGRTDTLETGVADKADRDLSNLLTTSINQPLLPDGDVNKNLGSALLRWNDLHIDDVFFNNEITFKPGGGADTLIMGTATSPFGASLSGVYSPRNSTPTGMHTKSQTSGAIDSADLLFGTGNVVDGTSGDLRLRAGFVSGTGSRGKVELDADHLDMTTGQIKNVANPTAAQDVATKDYVDGAAGSTGDFTFVSNVMSVGTLNNDLIIEQNGTGNIQLLQSRIVTFDDAYTSSWWGGDIEGMFFDSAAIKASGLGNNAVFIQTTDTSSASGTEPELYLMTGTNDSTSTGNTGLIWMQSGDHFDSGTSGKTGSVTMLSGYNEGSGDSGSVFLESGGTGSGGGNTGPTNIRTGQAQVGDSGKITVTTGRGAGTTSNSGDLDLLTGITLNGNSGDILVSPGLPSGTGTRGKIKFVDDSTATPGYVWTSTNLDGSGNWAAAAGAGMNTDFSNAVASTVDIDLNNNDLLKVRNISPNTALSGTVGTAALPFIKAYLNSLELYKAGPTKMGELQAITTAMEGGGNAEILLTPSLAGDGTGIITHNSTTATATGDLFLETGPNSSTGDTGNIKLTPGSVVSGTRGQVQVQDGSEGTIGHVLTSTGANGEMEWAAAPQGGINYISNYDAETNTDGYVVYLDPPNAFPFDGLGVVSGMVIDRTTTAIEVLRGNGSFKLIKDASNRIGEGTSYDFVIENADKAKVLRVSLDYSVSANFNYNSGTVADPSDVSLWIYDITNAVLIPLTNAYLDGSGKFESEFQTNSDSVEYRLIAHVSTTNASAWDFFFDNVQVGPRTVARGPMVTDWIDYTPTGGWGNVTYTGKYRRVGDSLEGQVEVECTSGAPTGTNLDNISIPSGLSIDSSKIANDNLGSTPFGNLIILNSGVALYEGTTRGDGAAPNTVSCLYDLGGGVSNINTTTPFAFGTGDKVTITFKVPIQGWDSNVVTSSDSGLRLVSGRFSTDTARTINNTTPAIIYETVEKDSHGAYNNTTGEYTIPESGDYDIGGGIRAVSASYAAGNFMGMAFYVNGSFSKYINAYRFESTITQSKEIIGSSLATNLKAGDVITWRIYSDTASALETSQTAFNYVWIAKRQSPQTIGMNETVSARATTLDSTTITAGTALQFTTEEFDTHGAFNPATGIFTAPVSGIYRCGLTGLNTNTDNLYRFFVNGSDASGFCGDSGTARISSMWAELKVNAGDTITIVPNSSVTASATTAQCSFTRVN